MSKRLYVLLFLVGLSSVAFAQDKEVVAIHGFDRMSCDDWTASQDDDSVRSMYIAWIRGIVTGYNYANPDNQVQLGRMPGDFTVGLFVDSYCRANRTKSFAGAAFELIMQKRGNGGGVVISDEQDTSTSPAKSPASSKLTGSPKSPNSPSVSSAASDDDGYNAWLKQQSDDMRSLDPKLLHNIYKKETAQKANQ